MMPLSWIAAAAASSAQDGAAFAPTRLDAALDVTAERRAFVELEVDHVACFVQQPLELTLRFGWDDEFLRTRMVQPFGVQLDVPAQLALPWLVQPNGALVLEPVAQARQSLDREHASVVVNERVCSASRAPSREIDGASFRVFEARATFAPTSVGVLEIPAPTLAFAYASRFEDDFVRGRVPLDRVDAFVLGAPLVLEVRALPETDRPPDFDGAVGDFELHAEVEPREIEFGASLKLRLSIEGRANMAAFGAPRWRDGGAFRVLGTTDERVAGARRVTYDLAPITPSAWQVPALQLAYFDPLAAGYRVASSRPIDVVVREREHANDGAPSAEIARGELDASARASSSAATRRWPLWLGAMVALGAAIAAAVRMRRRA